MFKVKTHKHQRTGIIKNVLKNNWFQPSFKIKFKLTKIKLKISHFLGRYKLTKFLCTLNTTLKQYF